MIILGPKQPWNEIYVYLAPLIEDLRILWEEGVYAYTSDNFKLHAMLFCIINDFPTCGNLSGYNVKEHKTCPIYENDSCFHQLKNGKNIVYHGHENF